MSKDPLGEQNRAEDLSKILYEEATEKAHAAGTAAELRHAANLFNRIKRYGDAGELAKHYYKLAEEADRGQRKKQFFISLALLAAITVAVGIYFILAPLVKYNNAVKMMEAKDYANAAEEFFSIDNYKDSRDLALECRYIYTKQLLDDGDLIDAVRNFAALGSYKDSSALRREYQLDAIRMAEIYDVVVYGEYLGTPIEWRVIDIEGDAVTMVSNGILSNFTKYNDNAVDVVWETSTVREMLNSKFVASFWEDERERILATEIVNADNFEYGTDAGADTVDYAFLLSAEEVERYFPTEELRVSNYSGSISWWLRTPGEDSRKAAYVRVDGTIHLNGTNVDRVQIGLRPAIRLNIAK